jgi:hypothetical protein
MPTILRIMLIGDADCNRDSAISVLLRLVEEGFVLSKVKHQTKRAVQHLQHYEVNKTSGTESLMQAAYFSPTKFIEHHVSSRRQKMERGTDKSLQYTTPSDFLEVESLLAIEDVQLPVSEAAQLPAKEAAQLPLNEVVQAREPETRKTTAESGDLEVIALGNVAEQIGSIYVGEV